MIFHASWQIFGESQYARADTLDKLNRAIFGQAYAPMPDSVFYWTTTPPMTTATDNI